MAAALAVAVAVVLAPTASASQSLRIGIFDDGVVLYGEPDLVFPQLQKTRTQLLRVNLWWSGPGITVATRKPKRPADPNDPAYNWDTYDRTVRFSIVNGIIPIFSIIGTPPWANAAKGWNVAPTNARDLQNFAAAAQKRYSGTFVNADGVVLPRVSLWMAWNEPNNPVFLKPQYRRVGKTWTIQSGRDYAKLCNAVVSGIKSVQRTSKVACGATGPRGNNNPNSSRPSVSPIPFLRAMKAGGAKGFDAYAQHPYYGSPAETPSDEAAARATRPAAHRRHAGQHRRADRRARQALRQADARLGHRVRLSDQPDRPDLRRPVVEAGCVPHAGRLDRARQPADRHVPLVPPPRRAAPFGLAVGPHDVRRQAEAELRRVPARRHLARRAVDPGRGGRTRLEGVGKGYAEGPAAEEAERRRDELDAGDELAPSGARLAVEGCTTDDPERHFLGWVGEVDPDALFASGAAWGIRVVRRSS